MNAKDEFKRAIRDFADAGRMPLLRWAMVKKVDKEEKTMTVVGVEDDLEYYDVELGLGSVFVYPPEDSTVLIGIVEGQASAAFLLSAEKAERIEVEANVEIALNGGDNGGMVLVGNLVCALNKIQQDVNNLKTAISGWTPLAQDGGAALKTALSTWFGEQIVLSKEKDLENEKLKQ